MSLEFNTNDNVATFETVFSTSKETFTADFRTNSEVNGASAYEVAVANGFEGTEAEWIASLKGDQGDAGYTPQKGVDYFDGDDGSDGQDGADGISVTHSWNGTTLTVTSASGTSSADLKGDTGATGATGADGKSAYQYAQEGGFTGTETEFIAKLVTAYLPIAGGTLTGELRVNGKDVAGGSKIVLESGNGQLTNSGTQTLFGFIDSSRIAVGHSNYILVIRGSAARLAYNGKDLALYSDVTSLDTRLSALEAAAVSVFSGTEAAMTVDVGEDGDIYLVTE